MMSQRICLLNDSFPPLIDGVANTVVNYAAHLCRSGDSAVVMTPAYPHTDDSAFPFPVIRYPSIDTTRLVGYRAGAPFSPEITRYLTEHPVDLLHAHCPVASTFLARSIRPVVHAPVVFTYHTKFDVDIAKAIHGKLLQESAIRALVQNISACDEVWVVSRGAGENLRSLGYTGDYILMPNGVDVPQGRVSQHLMDAVTGSYDLPRDTPLFLFVGRLMWYKGLRIILDALALLKEQGAAFRMVFIGDGADSREIKAYSHQAGLDSVCFFTGALHDREALRAWYCRADLFLFPSTFDTNGLVVREAAACGLGSVLIRGSCAAEDITEDENGFLIEENAASMAAKLQQLMVHPDAMHRVGQNAMAQLYLSWEDAVACARERYQAVIDRYRSGGYPPHHTVSDEFFTHSGELMEVLSLLEQKEQLFRREAHEHLHQLHRSWEQHQQQWEKLRQEERRQTEKQILDIYDSFWERYR